MTAAGTIWEKPRPTIGPKEATVEILPKPALALSVKTFRLTWPAVLPPMVIWAGPAPVKSVSVSSMIKVPPEEEDTPKDCKST